MDSTHKILVLVVTAVAVVAVIAVFALTNSVDDTDNEVVTPEPTPNAYFDYNITSTFTSFMSNGGFRINSDAGWMFVIAEIKIKNIDYEEGISCSTYPYILNINGIGYRGNTGVFSNHPLFLGDIYFMPGSNSICYGFWIVPESSDLDNATVTWRSGDSVIVVYDPTQF